MNDAPAESSAARARTWVIVLAVAVWLLLCGCASIVFLVLTGIIAEPVTVIEGIVRIIESMGGG